MTIDQMDDVIDGYCRSVNLCSYCKIKGLCDAANGNFAIHTDLCEQAYNIVKYGCIPIANVNDDPVNHPAHYNKGKIEVSDFIADQKLNFDRGNAVKYVCRAGAKDPDKEIQDLEKAIWYINHEIKMLKGEANDAAEKEN